MRLREWLIVPAFALAVMVINVAISFAVVWVYSLFEPATHRPSTMPSPSRPLRSAASCSVSR